jgi:hypothetical protein
MPRSIHLLTETALVEIRFVGPVTFAERTELLETLRPLVREHRLKGALVDYANAWVGESSTAEFEELEAHVRAATWLAGLRIALISPAEFHALPVEPLSDVVGYEVRRFYTRAAALEWLAA